MFLFLVISITPPGWYFFHLNYFSYISWLSIMHKISRRILEWCHMHIGTQETSSKIASEYDQCINFKTWLTCLYSQQHNTLRIAYRPHKKHFSCHHITPWIYIFLSPKTLQWTQIKHPGSPDDRRSMYPCLIRYAVI